MCLLGNWLRHVQLARVVRVNEGCLQYLLRVSCRDGVGRSGGGGLRHAGAHFGDQPEEKWQEGANTTIVEVEAPLNVLLKTGAFEGWRSAGQVIGTKDRLIEALIGQRSNW